MKLWPALFFIFININTDIFIVIKTTEGTLSVVMLWKQITVAPNSSSWNEKKILLCHIQDMLR